MLHVVLLRQLTDIPGVRVLRHYRNEGIARGLNDGLRAAEHQQARWLLDKIKVDIIDGSWTDVCAKAGPAKIQTAR